MDASNDGAAARRFGNFEVLDFIGTSGSTRVYRARQISMDRLVTLSILPRQAAEKPVLRQRFQRQVEAASRLRHPHILSALDGGSIAGHQYIAAEYVGGRPLATALDDGEWFGIRRCADIALAVARALEHVDSVGMIHRNVAPRAILLGDGGLIKLRGFSFSRPSRDVGRETWFDAEDATVSYRAPDWVRETTLDIRADLYSLGCVLFHLLAGRPPFVASNPATLLERHVKDEPPDVRTLRDDTPESLVHVLAKSLVKDRDRRYATPADMVADLEAVHDGRPVDPPRRSRRSRFLRRRN